MCEMIDWSRTLKKVKQYDYPQNTGRSDTKRGWGLGFVKKGGEDSKSKQFLLVICQIMSGIRRNSIIQNPSQRSVTDKVFRNDQYKIRVGY